MDAVRAVVDFILHIDVHLAALAGDYGVWFYAILALIVFAETGFVVTPFLPGDSLLFAAGALASNPAFAGRLNVHAMAALLIAAAIAGNTLNYAIGRRLGPRAYRLPFVRPDYVRRTEAFFARHGGKTVVMTRFVPIVRTFAPFVAGIGAMPYGRFQAYNVAGAFAWVLLFLYAGFFFGNLPVVRDNFGLVAIGIVVVSVLPAVVQAVRSRSSSPTGAPDAHP